MTDASTTPRARAAADFGALLRDWRARRRLSQLALALTAEVSPRHLSFLESGRAKPSRAMILRLAEALDAPLAERNAMLEAAGFARAFPAAPLGDEALTPVRAALQRMLATHAPYPAMLIDRYWTLIEANQGAAAFFGDAATPGVNVLDAMQNNPAVRARIENWAEAALAVAARIKAESRHAGGDARLEAMAAALTNDPACAGADHLAPSPGQAAFPLTLRFGDAALSFFTVIASIGSPVDVTVTDLRVELFYPANAATEAAFAG